MANRRRPLWTFLALMLPVAGMLIAERFLVDEVQFSLRILKDGSLTEAQEKQLELLLEQSKMLTTFATAVVGAIAALAFKGTTVKPAGRIAKAALLVAVLCAGLSLYFGYIHYQELGWMLHQPSFNAEEWHVQWTARLQFFLFLGSVFAAAYFVFIHVIE